MQTLSLVTAKSLVRGNPMAAGKVQLPQDLLPKKSFLRDEGGKLKWGWSRFISNVKGTVLSNSGLIFPVLLWDKLGIVAGMGIQEFSSVSDV